MVSLHPVPLPHPALPASTLNIDPETTQTNDPDRRPKFPKDTCGFTAEVQKRVSAYFKQTGRSERDHWSMYLKTFIIMAWIAASFLLLVFVANAWWQVIPLALSLAFAMAAIGFDIQHDGGHQAYSKYSWVNRLAAVSLDIMGASSYLWHWKHVIFHHTYVNVTGVDTDIDQGKLVRLTPHQQWFKAHRWQHIYLFPLYGVMAARWHLYGDFKDIILGKIGNHKIPRPKGLETLIFWGGKTISISVLLGVPLMYHSWWIVALVYLFVMGVLGVVMSIVFQLAHCVEEADFPMPAEDTFRLESAWAVHQLQTTVDFSRNNWLMAWYLGGLNYQIEHHLFPRICHVHYPAIAKIVEQTCKEYGIRYAVHTTFWSGVKSHYRWLWRMGHPSERDPIPAGITG